MTVQIRPPRIVNLATSVPIRKHKSGGWDKYKSSRCDAETTFYKVYYDPFSLNPICSQRVYWELAESAKYAVEQANMYRKHIPETAIPNLKGKPEAAGWILKLIVC